MDEELRREQELMRLREANREALSGRLLWKGLPEAAFWLILALIAFWLVSHALTG